MRRGGRRPYAGVSARVHERRRRGALADSGRSGAWRVLYQRSGAAGTRRVARHRPPTHAQPRASASRLISSWCSTRSWRNAFGATIAPKRATARHAAHAWSADFRPKYSNAIIGPNCHSIFKRLNSLGTIRDWGRRGASRRQPSQSLLVAAAPTGRYRARAQSGTTR